MTDRSIEIVAVVAAAAMLLILALTLRVTLLGDSHYYYGMLVGLADHWSPALTADVWEKTTDAFGLNLEPTLVLEGKDGLTYPLHFFAYPLSGAPLYRLIELLHLDPFRAFMVANTAYISIALAYVLIASTLSALARWSVAVVFLLGSASLYFQWASPEVMSSSLLLIGAVALLDRRFVLSIAATAIASLQNPSIAAFAALVLLACGIMALFGRSGTFIQRLTRLVPAALAFALCLIPYAWSLWKFGVINPIAATGFLDYTLISPARFLSLLVDLNQGLIVGLPFLIPAFTLLILYRLFSAMLGRGPLVRQSDLLLLGFLLIAVPVLGQRNWNAGQTLFIRYAAWSGMLPIAWCAYEATMIRKGFGQVAIASGIVLQAAMAMAFGGINVDRISSRLSFQPWVIALWDINPQLYDPLPDIFYERLMRAEGDVVHPTPYRDANGAMLKILVQSKTLAAATKEVCGPGNALIPVNAEPTSAPVLRASEQGYGFISGRLDCAFGVPGIVDLSQTALNHPLLVEGWGRFDPTGSWTTATHAKMSIHFAKPVSGRVMLRLFGAGYVRAAHPEQTIIVSVKKAEAGRWTVRYRDPPFAQSIVVDLGPKATRKLDLDFALPDAVSPKSLGESTDARTLGIHLSRIELSRP